MSRYTSSSDRYNDDYFRQYERPDQTVHTIMDNLSKGGVQHDYASQWAKYYRSQGMNREAQLIEDHVRNKAEREGRGGYGTSVCYRCDRIGHFARECPEFTGIRKPRSPDRRKEIGPQSLPARTGGGSVCYRCNGVGHFARECPQYTGIRRDAPSSGSGGGPMRRVAHPAPGQPPGTSECYRCNKIGHFARECPEYTGTPYPNAYRGAVIPYSGGGRGRGQPGDYGTSKCLKCNKYGHFARECREPENLCYKCHEPGHIQKDCSKADLCYVCNKEGHLAKDCPDGNRKTCYKCSGKGHIAPDCPSKQSVIDKINAKKATVDVIDEKAGDQVLSMKDLEDL